MEKLISLIYHRTTQNKWFLFASFAMMLVIGLFAILHNGRGYLQGLIYLFAIWGIHSLFVVFCPDIIKSRVWRFAIHAICLPLVVLLFIAMTMCIMLLGLTGSGIGYGDGYPSTHLSESIEWLCLFFAQSLVFAPYGWITLFKTLFSKSYRHPYIGIIFSLMPVFVGGMLLIYLLF